MASQRMVPSVMAWSSTLFRIQDSFNYAEEFPKFTNIITGLEIREYGRRDPPCSQRGILYTQTLALTSPTSGRRSLGRYSSLADSDHEV
jgi:hypothetical protein